MDIRKTPLKVMEKHIYEISLEMARLAKDLRDKSAFVGELADEKDRLEKLFKAKGFEIKKMREALIIRADIPDEVQGMRNLIFSKLEKLKSEDITVAMKKLLEQEVRGHSQKLMELCGHHLVLDYAGYEGSRFVDYENGYYGRRVCAICAFFEFSRSKKENIYETLLEKDGRLIKMVFSDEEWQGGLRPLEYVRKKFLDSAGSPLV